jgi:hypothetical protein
MEIDLTAGSEGEQQGGSYCEAQACYEAAKNPPRAISIRAADFRGPAHEH